MKVDKYHKFSNLTLKWCKMPFYLILFQCEIWNMTSLDVHNKWVCTFPPEIFHLSNSQIQRRFYWISWRFRNEVKIPPYKNPQTRIFEMWRHWMFLDVNKFCTAGRVSNTVGFYTVLMWGKRRDILFHFHKDFIYWKMSASQNWIWPFSPPPLFNIKLT